MAAESNPPAVQLNLFPTCETNHGLFTLSDDHDDPVNDDPDEAKRQCNIFLQMTLSDV